MRQDRFVGHVITRRSFVGPLAHTRQLAPRPSPRVNVGANGLSASLSLAASLTANLVLCAGLAHGQGGASVESDASNSTATTQASNVVTTDAPVIESPRTRGLNRFFDHSQPVLCATGKAKGLPIFIRDWNPGEPDPAPILAMTLDPMYDENGRPRVAACFDAVNPPSAEFINAVEASLGAFDRFQANNRWSGGSFGTAGNPITLTYSFVPDGLNIPNGVGEPAAPSSLFATMDAEFGTRATWISLFQQCFDRWAYLTGTSYVRVTAAGVDWDDNSAWGTGGNGTTRGDVRIGAKPIDGQNGVLAYNNFPNGGDMVLDSAEDYGGQSTTNEANNFRFFRNTVMHEHGHGLGFSHTCPIAGAALMEPFLNTSFDGPRHDDLRGASNHYGDAFGNISTTALAFNIGTLADSTSYNPTAITVGGSVPNSSLASIDASAEVDVFKVNVPGPQQVTITLAPQGLNYATYAQDANCNNTTPNVNSLTRVDLDFDILASNGSLLLARSLQPVGVSESFTGYVLPPGDSFIRVKRNPGVAYISVQLYSLTVTAFTPPVVTASDGSNTDQVDLTWTNIFSSTGFNVYRSTVDNRAGASLIGSADAGDTGFTDTTAVPGTAYFYWVEVSQGDPMKPLNVAGEAGSRGIAPPATGACCTGAACVLATAADCANAGGSYAGNDVPCVAGANNPTTCCPANFDQTGGVTAVDLFGFLDAWFVQNGSTGAGFSADFDQNDAVDASDLFGFLDAWFLGCS